ncbi:MAG: hypothetical protein KY446_12560 [Proteobacteria bacterium]|nr:hypothetical protein [Pseudomonadota bacterium]
MSGLLVFRWLVPLFALAVAATVWLVGGPLAAGLCMVAFLLGVVTCELHHMRWTSVEEPTAASDSAFLALMAAGGQMAPREAAAPPSAPEPPPPPPKRNFRLTCQDLAIGSGEIRLELVARRRLHLEAAARPREGVGRPEPARAACAEAVESQPPMSELPESEVPESVLQLEPDMVELLLVPVPEPRPEPQAEPTSTLSAGAPRHGLGNSEVPPPRVTVLAAPGPDRKRAVSEAFRSSYVSRSPR